LTDAFTVGVMCDMGIGQEQCSELETFGNPRNLVENVQGTYKLSEDFAKPYFHKY
jgi:hypothetical protein